VERTIGPLLCLTLLFGVVGCDSVTALFEKKPLPQNGETKSIGPVGPGGESKTSVSKHVNGEQTVNDRPVPQRFSFPAGLAVGAWARWRFTLEEFDKEWERELAVVGTQGQNLWIEETSNTQGFEEVTLRLVSPEGKVLDAYRGKPGTRGSRHKVDPTLGVEADPLADAKSTGKQEDITVSDGKVACVIHTLGGGGKAWLSSDIPFSGLVKFQTAEASGVLLAFGADRKATRLQRALK